MGRKDFKDYLACDATQLVASSPSVRSPPGAARARAGPAAPHAAAHQRRLPADGRRGARAARRAAANLTGTPAMNVPLHRTADGLLLGVQFVAPSGREDRLLQLAAQLEQARSWFGRLPRWATQAGI